MRIERDDIQGNVLAGYAFDHARHIFLAGAGDRLRRCLTAIAPDIQHAVSSDSWHERTSAVNIAVTYKGFAALGVPPKVIEAFPKWFRDSMSDRATRLGDTGASAPAEWSDRLGTGHWHLLLTVSGASPEAVTARVADLEPALQHLEQQGYDVHVEQDRAEHFGYTDGFAQPDIEGVARKRPHSARGGGVPTVDGGWRQLKLGEFVLGYPDENGDTDSRPTPALSRNATYMVFRRLQQNVGRFRAAVTAAANRSGLSESLIRAKIIGRWPNGMPVEISPYDDGGERSTPPPNDFRYLPHDRDGHSCPLGAHIRRANPRDALDLGGSLKDSGLSTSRHRIIRRAMLYGPPLGENQPDDRVERGMAFVCYNADIERQFEVVQRQWIGDGDVFGLGADVDFLFAGDGGSMTIPRIGNAPAFVPTAKDLVVTRGCEYLFVPGISGLRILATGCGY